jgi:hypothetical protein
MILIEAIRDLASLDDNATIYAAEPWADDSPAIVIPETDAGELPTEAKKLGLRYFLEVFVAREFLEGWKVNLMAIPTLHDTCARVIQYARTDA